MYVSLARKYRPRTFADVAVQSHVTTTLQGAIARGRVAHAYLLCGPRGVGKTTLARVLAMALNCERRAERRDGEPCGQCGACQRIWSGAASLDVVEIDAASNRGVEDARALRERAMYAPAGEDGYKVYIVDEAHMLTREAWNALLKILEEPPPRVVFVFATTEPQRIAQAAAPVLSRVQRFDFRRIGPAEVRQRLATVLAAEGIAVESDALTLLARAADGSLRDALSLADQTLVHGDGVLTVTHVREALGLVPEEEHLALLDLIAGGRAAEVFPHIARLVDAGVDLGALLGGLADLLRAQLAIELGGEAVDVSAGTRDALLARRGRLAAPDLLRMLQLLTELEPRFRRSGQQQLLLETLLVRLALMDRTVLLAEVLQAMGGGGVAARGGAESTMPTTAPMSSTPVTPSTPTAPSGAARSAPAATPSVVPVATPAVEPDDAAAQPLELSGLVERWGGVIEAVRAGGRGMLAAALERARPESVTAHGEIVLALDAAEDVFAQAIAAGEGDVLAAVHQRAGPARRLRVRMRQPEPAQGNVPRRLTAEGARADRLATLRRRDPALDAAVEALDLELLDE